MNFKNILKWLGARAKEPSTYAGLSAIALALGQPQLAVPIKIAGVLLGSIGVVKAEAPAAPVDATPA